MTAANSFSVRRAHRVTSLVLTVFGALHLANHWVAPWGPGPHQAVQSALRVLYRNPVGESLLVLSVVVQAVTGVLLWFQTRPRAPATESKLRKWRRASGAYLAFFLVAHTSAAFIQRFVVGLDTNFYWAAGVLRWPLAVWFVPYYAAAIVSFCVHVGSVLWPKQLNRFAVLGLVSSLVIIGGLAGWFSTFEIPAEYR